MSLKFIVLGDLHLRTTNPENRIDNILEAIKSKLEFVFNYAKEHNVTAILCPGDTFDAGQVSNSTLIAAADIILKCPVPIITAVGNHDMFNYNINTYKRTSLYVLGRLTNRFYVRTADDFPFDFEDSQHNKARITCQELCNELDRGDGFGYSIPEKHYDEKVVNIRIIHSMLLNHKPPFEQYTLVKDVKTNADVLISGHDHTGYGVIKQNNTTFINPGSLLRLSASKNELNRKIQMCVIEIKYKQVNTELIEIPHKPGIEVLDRTKIEESNERQYAMDAFSALLKKNDVDCRVDIMTILNEIASAINEEKRIVKMAEDKILKYLHGEAK